MPLLVGSVVAMGCGASSSNAPASTAPAAASAAPAASTAAPVAVGSATPSDMPAPTMAQADLTQADTSTQQEDEEVASELVDHLRHHHHGGIGLFLAMSLDTLGTTPEQHEAIEKIQTGLRTKLEPARAAELKVVNLLADGIAAGKVDQPKVDAAIARVGTASAGVHGAVIDALNQLHSVLNDAQRVALVDKVEAHWEVWKEANAAAGDAAERPEHGRFEMLTRDLALTPEQVDKIKTRLKSAGEVGPKFDPEKVAAHLTALGNAFESESFDAKAAGAGEGVSARMSTWAATGMAHFYEAVAPVLTPEQRTKLADRVREHANHKENPAAG